MKRFGLGAVVGFVAVFGTFYLVGLTGEAGEHAFESLTDSQEQTVSVEEGSKTFSALGEPSVQDSKAELSGTKSKHEAQRVPSSGSEDEMQVTLRKAKEPKQVAAKKPAAPQKPESILVEEQFPTKKIAMIDSKEPVEHHRESNFVGSYSVQVSSNTDKAASDVLLEQLEAKGFHGFVQAATVNDKQFYRVKLGPVNSKEEAVALKEKASQMKGFSGAIIARE